MKQRLRILFTLIMWAGMAVIAAVLSGIINDQMTVTLSPEYFSVFKRAQFGPLLEAAGLGAAPTRIQAILVGAAATWWFGLLLGIMVAVAGTIGGSPRLTTSDFMKAVGGVMLVTAVTSLAFGCVGYATGPIRNAGDTGRIDELWPFLQGIEDTRRAFAVGLWHDGAYLGGLVGSAAACVWAWIRRRSYRRA